jgi:hypothetical protein
VTAGVERKGSAARPAARRRFAVEPGSPTNMAAKILRSDTLAKLAVSRERLLSRE